MLSSESRNLLVWDLCAVWDMSDCHLQHRSMDRTGNRPDQLGFSPKGKPFCTSWQSGLAPSASVLQERLDAARQALSEARRQSSSLAEQVQTLRGELANMELQRGDAEGQLQQLQQVRPGGPLSIGMPHVVLGMGWGTHSTSPQLTQPPVQNHGSSGPHSHYTQREPFGLRCFPTRALQLGTVGQHLCS